MKKFTAFFVIISILLIPINSYALKKVGQTGLKFLDVAVGARPTGMGEAYTVVGNDANALFFNPAGIAQMNSKFDLTVSITDWIADISYNACGFAVDAGNWGNFGVSIISPDYGAVAGTEIAPTEAGYTEMGLLEGEGFAAGLCYAHQLTNKFSFGAQIKYTSQHLGSNRYVEGGESHENRVSGLAYDVGTLFYPRFDFWKTFGFGMSIRNFSVQFKYEEVAFQLPLLFTMGFCGDLLDLLGESQPDKALNVEIDALHPRDYTERLHIGLEYIYKDLMTVRAGYKFNYDEAGLTLGVGFNVGGVKFDYAYGDFGKFDLVNRVSVGMSFQNMSAWQRGIYKNI